MLEEFGLTQTEEKVYLVLSQSGISPASDIIKKTQLHRTTVYDVLNRLIEKGIVSFVIKNKINAVKEDPDDDKIIECAIESNSEYILTYDNHLLKIKEYKGVKILRPEEFKF